MTVKHLSILSIVVAALAAALATNASASSRYWVGGSGTDLTGKNWSTSTGGGGTLVLPAAADTGQLGQGNSGTGWGAPVQNATTTPTVTGTYNPTIINANIGVDVTITGTGKIVTGGTTLGTSSYIRLNGVNGATLNINNAELDINSASAGNEAGIFGNDGQNLSIGASTVFKMGTGTGAGTALNLTARPTSLYTINPTVDLSAITNNQDFHLSASYDSTEGKATVNLLGGITGSSSFTTNVIINSDSVNYPGDSFQGFVTIGGTSSFTGTTTIGGGTVDTSGTATFTGTYNGSGTTTVNSLATIAGGGSIGGPVDLNGIISPGNAAGTAGTLTVGGLSIENGSSLTADLQNTAGAHAPGGGANDLIAITNGAGTLTVPAGSPAFTLNLASTISSVGTWTLATYNALAGLSVPNFTINGLSGVTGQITIVPNSLGNPTGPGQVILTTTAVPEPSTFVLAGLGLAGLGFVRLRKRK